MEARIPIGESSLIATGTGTDCLAILSPKSSADAPQAAARYAGKHTDIGYAVGAACYRAVNHAMARVQAASGLSPRAHG
jgi:adenosylcobinamide amidohydrolase